MEMEMAIIIDDLTGPEVAELLNEHLRSMSAQSPPESMHALDLEGLRRPEITFWSAWDGKELLGCGALKDLGGGHGELKSMRTASAHLRKGVARGILTHIVAEAKRRGFTRLSLETGSMASFEPARKLYERFGFDYCAPFADYEEDPNSAFMTRAL
ncbi:putative acetyltransferase [Paenibacillus sp. UNC496MF]|nr:putative acetyltransferase [Paenibacillus sp. UNC496MF]